MKSERERERQSSVLFSSGWQLCLSLTSHLLLSSSFPFSAPLSTVFYVPLSSSPSLPLLASLVRASSEETETPGEQNRPRSRDVVPHFVGQSPENPRRAHGTSWKAPSCLKTTAVTSRGGFEIYRITRGEKCNMVDLSESEWGLKIHVYKHLSALCPYIPCDCVWQQWGAHLSDWDERMTGELLQCVFFVGQSDIPLK